MLTFLIVFGLLCPQYVAKEIVPSLGEYFTIKNNENCDIWASNDHECSGNPTFMWANCYTSCVERAENQNELCDQWGNEGECTSNPSYLHVHCPRSCGTAIAWSPWIRQNLGIQPLRIEDPDLGKDEHYAPPSISIAADIMRFRIDKYLHGMHSVVQGFTSTAPTEYLGMLGLTEAMLYTMRLYEVILHNQTSLREAHVGRMQEITRVLKQGYSPDPLLRYMKYWKKLVDESAKVVETLLQEGGQAGREANSINNEMNHIVQYYLGIPLEELQSLANLSEKDSEAAASGQSIPLLPQEILLPHGGRLPTLGLGTWQLEGDECIHAVVEAIRLGYRLIDTAQAYRNEKAIGNAIQFAYNEEIVTRAELFIMSKVSDPANAGFMEVQQLVQSQLDDLQIDYFDLYMLHSPLEDRKVQEDTWKALESLHHTGKIRALGVSNFDSRALQDLLQYAKVKPVVIENKLDVYHVGKQLDNRGDRIAALAKEHQVTMMAYSPFSAYPFMMLPLEDPLVRYVSKEYAHRTGVTITPAQVVLKWILQRNLTVIPRSISSQRLAENLAVYTMPAMSVREMSFLDTLQLLISSPVAVPILLD